MLTQGLQTEDSSTGLEPNSTKSVALRWNSHLLAGDDACSRGPSSNLDRAGMPRLGLLDSRADSDCHARDSDRGHLACSVRPVAAVLRCRRCPTASSPVALQRNSPGAGRHVVASPEGATERLLGLIPDASRDGRDAELCGAAETVRQSMASRSTSSSVLRSVSSGG
jgi:hypothetical protein